MDGVEIERRFLVDGRGPRPWLDSNEGVVPMLQVYRPDVGLEVEAPLTYLSAHINTRGVVKRGGFRPR